MLAHAWTNKAIFGPQKLDIRARGKFGIIRKPYARILFILKKGTTPEQKEEAKMQRMVSRLARSAGQVREDIPLRRKVVSDWAW